MNEYFKIKKKTLYLICIVVLVIAAIVTVTVLIVNYNAKPKPPVYELKLYGIDWTELEKNNAGGYISYEVEYDGTQKGINAICYMDGKEFFRYDYHWSGKYNEPIPVSVDFKGFFSKFPTERGEYLMGFGFENAGYYSPNYIFHTPIGEIRGADLPGSELYHQVTLIIK